MVKAMRWSCVLAAVVVLGCAKGGDPNRPQTYPATGTVTYNGQPVSEATVLLISTTSGGRGASGMTDASGNFTLTTFEAGDGALPGSYKVRITKTIVEDAPAEPGEPTAPGEEPNMGTQKDLIPAKYKDPNESGLTADVKEGPNTFTFELKD